MPVYRLLVADVEVDPVSEPGRDASGHRNDSKECTSPRSWRGSCPLRGGAAEPTHLVGGLTRSWSGCAIARTGIQMILDEVNPCPDITLRRTSDRTDRKRQKQENPLLMTVNNRMQQELSKLIIACPMSLCHRCRVGRISSELRITGSDERIWFAGLRGKSAWGNGETN